MGSTPFHLAANMGNMEICKLFIEKFPMKNPADDNGITPLHNAVRVGNFDLFMLIAQSLFDINPKTNNGSTPLHFAAFEGHYNIQPAPSMTSLVCSDPSKMVCSDPPTRKDHYKPF